MTAAPKQKAPILRLEPGSDLVGTVKFISFYPEKPNPEKPDEPFAAQWGLTGKFNGADGRVFIAAHQIETALPTQPDGQWPDGNPKYRWNGQGEYRIHKYVKEKRHYVQITPADGAVQPAQAGSGAPAGRSTAAAVPSAPSPVGWSELEKAYNQSVDIALRAWSRAIDSPVDIVAATATVFIEANKRGLTVPLTATEQAVAIRDTFDKMPEQLDDDSDALPF